MADELRLVGNFKLGDVWALDAPEDFVVKKEEPVKKHIPPDALGVTADTLAVVYALRDSGVVEWVRKKSFDVLWDYLRSVVLKLPPASNRGTRRATFELKDPTGAVLLHADITAVDLATFDAARVAIKEELVRANGDTERREITVDLSQSSGRDGDGEADGERVAAEGTPRRR